MNGLLCPVDLKKAEGQLNMEPTSDLISLREPPMKRAPYVDGTKEKMFTEGAVMLAFAWHLFDSYPDIGLVEIHPDGQHGKSFDIRSWLEAREFALIKPQGRTAYGGTYKRGNQELLVTPKSGLGDVVGRFTSSTIIAECKGGVINSTHAGQVSRLRRGLCETVGQLMGRSGEGEKHFSVVPFTPVTQRLADTMRLRCAQAGIDIVLVREDGSVV